MFQTQPLARPRRRERFLFGVVITAALGGAIFALTSGAPTLPGPQLVPVEQAAPAAPTVTAIPAVARPAAAPDVVAQPARAAKYELPTWFWQAPEPLVTSPALTVSETTEAPSASEAREPGSTAAQEALATTAPEPDGAAPANGRRTIEVEHELSTIPDPPDVGASGRTKSFEIERPAPPEDPWAGVRRCESHNNYSTNTGNSFYGAYQFTISTWNWVAAKIDRADLVGLRPDLATPSDQDRMAQALGFEIAGGGLGHWPVCGRFYG